MEENRSCQATLLSEQNMRFFMNTLRSLYCTDRRISPSNYAFISCEESDSPMSCNFEL